jgi:imidazolonepropionase-like amidohydrolase
MGGVRPLHVRAVVLPDATQHDLWVDADGRVTYQAVPGAETVASGGFVLPGLVDAHCHVGLDEDGAVPDDVAEEQALADRAAGALLLRDAGSPADTRWVQDRGDLPRLVRAGRHIARTKRYIRNYGAEVEPPELVAEVERQAARGDGWVKLVGDWIDRDTGDLSPCWPAEAVTAAIARAHELGVRVTAHVFGEEALAPLIDAGIDCIEHGTGLTEELAARMSARGTALVPTRLQLDNFPSYARAGQARFPRYAARMLDLYGRLDATLRSAHEAGVPIYAGTDAGGVVAHGLIAQEVRALHERVGLPRADALAAGCWAARGWLGFPGLEEGAPADLVVYPENPLADLAVLARPARVVLRGRVVA